MSEHLTSRVGRSVLLWMRANPVADGERGWSATMAHWRVREALSAHGLLTPAPLGGWMLSSEGEAFATALLLDPDTPLPGA